MILKELMPGHGEGVYLQGPIQFDFGTHIKMGLNSYANFNFCVLDENWVTIGNNVFIGHNCSILTPIHPLCFEDRNIFHDDKTDADINIEYSAPVVIEDNCWIDGGHDDPAWRYDWGRLRNRCRIGGHKEHSGAPSGLWKSMPRYSVHIQAGSSFKPSVAF